MVEADEDALTFNGGSLALNDSLEDFEILPAFNDSFSSTLDTAGFLDIGRIRLPLVNVSLANVSAVLEHRMAFGIEQLKAAPKSMTLGSGTPWCHTLLYEMDMPRSMQDCFATCALYVLKNEKTATQIWRLIDLRVDELLSTPPPATALELLSRTQALLLYQIMRAFEGSLRERTRADVTMHDLESCAQSLHSLADHSDDSSMTLSHYPTGPSNAFWRSWILRESVRRTVLTCFYFLSVYHLIKEDFHYCIRHIALTSFFTGSAHLWNARSVFDFTTAWKEKKHFVVRDFDFTEMIAEAKTDDIDCFDKLLLVPYMGIDDARGWVEARGGAL